MTKFTKRMPLVIKEPAKENNNKSKNRWVLITRLELSTKAVILYLTDVRATVRADDPPPHEINSIRSGSKLDQYEEYRPWWKHDLSTRTNRDKFRKFVYTENHVKQDWTAEFSRRTRQRIEKLARWWAYRSIRFCRYRTLRTKSLTISLGL